MIIYEEIFRAFQKERVQYIIVGGIAVNLLGGIRGTADLDILVKMTNGNLKKIVTILKRQGYVVRQPVDPMGIADKKIRYEWIHQKNMKAFNFYKEKEFKEVDIIISSPVSYEKARPHITRIAIGSLRLPVISIDHLVLMKKKAGRKVDVVDIDMLRIVKKEWRKK